MDKQRVNRRRFVKGMAMGTVLAFGLGAMPLTSRGEEMMEYQGYYGYYTGDGWWVQGEGHYDGHKGGGFIKGGYTKSIPGW